MKRALLATGAAVILAAAAFVTPADPRGRGGGGGGGSGGHAHSSSAGFARSSGISSGGSFSRNGGSFSRNAGNFSRNGGSFSRNAVVRNSVVVRNSNVGRNFAGVHHRRHFRRGFVAFGPGYASYGYADGCVVPQRVLTNYGWQIVYVNVCGYDDDDY